MEKDAFDIHIWLTQNDSSQDEIHDQNCAFYFQGKKVGEASVGIRINAYAPREKMQFYPDSWFCAPPQKSDILGSISPMKPFLEITRYDFFENVGKGYGRWGLQKLYQLSCQLGAEGRISLDAQNHSAGFYEHFGFVGIISGEDGRKYFDPTEENVKALFSKKADENFILKENVRPFRKEELKIFKRKLDSFVKN